MYIVNASKILRMSTIWEFLKRHRGKLLMGAVVAGGAFAVGQILSKSFNTYGMQIMEPSSIRVSLFFVKVA